MITKLKNIATRLFAFNTNGIVRATPAGYENNGNNGISETKRYETINSCSSVESKYFRVLLNAWFQQMLL